MGRWAERSRRAPRCLPRRGPRRPAPAGAPTRRCWGSWSCRSRLGRAALYALGERDRRGGRRSPMARSGSASSSCRLGSAGSSPPGVCAATAPAGGSRSCSPSSTAPGDRHRGRALDRLARNGLRPGYTADSGSTWPRPWPSSRSRSGTWWPAASGGGDKDPVAPAPAPGLGGGHRVARCVRRRRGICPRGGDARKVPPLHRVVRVEGRSSPGDAVRRSAGRPAARARRGRLARGVFQHGSPAGTWSIDDLAARAEPIQATLDCTGRVVQHTTVGRGAPRRASSGPRTAGASPFGPRPAMSDDSRDRRAPALAGRRGGWGALVPRARCAGPAGRPGPAGVLVGQVGDVDPRRRHAVVVAATVPADLASKFVRPPFRPGPVRRLVVSILARPDDRR